MKRHDPNDPAWHALLEQVGMHIDEHGRYWITRPRPCEHEPHERNIGRDQLSCDGCRFHQNADSRQNLQVQDGRVERQRRLACKRST